MLNAAYYIEDPISLEGCTLSNRGQRPRTASTPPNSSLEGCTPARMQTPLSLVFAGVQPSRL